MDRGMASGNSPAHRSNRAHSLAVGGVVLLQVSRSDPIKSSTEQNLRTPARI